MGNSKGLKKTSTGTEYDGGCYSKCTTEYTYYRCEMCGEEKTEWDRTYN